jgi:hypothetical protein
VPDRPVLIYFSWSRPQESSAPLAVIDDRFPAIFELRRLFYPNFETLAVPAYDQGIAGFLDQVQRPNFAEFAEHMGTLTGAPVRQAERVADDGRLTALGSDLIADCATIVVISFDSLRTGQAATTAEIEAIRGFLSHPDHLIVVCPHHGIGEADAAADAAALRLAEHLHHGDKAIPPRQGFGGFARTLLAGLGVPVVNRFGLRPATAADGSPAPIDVERSLDRLKLLEGVPALNLHAHLPQLERVGPSATRMDVLARQRIDVSAPPHPFSRAGGGWFDAILQSARDAFEGTILVTDTTLWSSTAGGIDNLRRLWTNLAQRDRSVPGPPRA